MLLPKLENLKCSLLLVNKVDGTAIIECADHGEWTVSLKKLDCPTCISNRRKCLTKKNYKSNLEARLYEFDSFKNGSVSLVEVYNKPPTAKSKSVKMVVLKCVTHKSVCFPVNKVMLYKGCSFCFHQNIWIKKAGLEAVDIKELSQAIGHKVVIHSLSIKYGVPKDKLQVLIRHMQRRQPKPQEIENDI